MKKEIKEKLPAVIIFLILLASFIAYWWFLFNNTNKTKSLDETNQSQVEYNIAFDEMIKETQIKREYHSTISDEQKLKGICDQEMIPAMYASDCYFLEFKDCNKFGGGIIPKSELEKCLPIYLKEAINPIDAFFNLSPNEPKVTDPNAEPIKIERKQ
ncbi:MAG: hypothetical protein PHZ07_02205 [Patescibacteria group bacterium]|nr:hypothetical protein [Patescibacteria group bacterium]MDD4304520.1 hypothetical protein [Patescibacteria group bacterium]MDD4694880.1 hypothetical protein [Patescibacteria group bacterium]